MKSGYRAVLATACVCGLLAAVPGHALLIPNKFNSDEVVVELTTFPGDPVVRSVEILGTDISGGALDTVKYVTISIEFMKCAGSLSASPSLPTDCPDTINNAFADEIMFVLRNPSGTQITLVDFLTYESGPAGSRVTVTFDDAAAAGVGPALANSPPSVQPVGLLSTFWSNGEGAVGTWDLLMFDENDTDPLGFARFDLYVTVCDANDTDSACPQQAQAPIPATALLLGLGLAGLAVSRKRLN